MFCQREEMVNEELKNIVNDQKLKNIVNDQKSCVDCKAKKTPLWRSGPAGPKSLCNACGIRYRKKRKYQKRDLNRDEEEKKINLKEEKLESSSSERRVKKIKLKDEKIVSSSCKMRRRRRRRKVSEDLRRRVMALGDEVVLLQRRPRSPAKRQKRKKSSGGDHNNIWKKIGEVEQAAVLLMAMSCGKIQF